jgi:CBS domain-containing protein
MRARQIMTPHVITVGADTSIIKAVNMMLRHHISGLPVVDAAGKLIGIVSEGDFIRRAETGTQHKRGRWLTFLAGADRVATEFAHEHGRKVGEIMTPNPLTVAEDTPLDQIVQIMVETPKKLTARQEELFRELAGLDDKHVSPKRKGFMETLKRYFTEE